MTEQLTVTTHRFIELYRPTDRHTSTAATLGVPYSSHRYDFFFFFFCQLHTNEVMHMPGCDTLHCDLRTWIRITEQ
jgi:hypothetical protein